MTISEASDGNANLRTAQDAYEENGRPSYVTNDMLSWMTAAQIDAVVSYPRDVLNAYKDSVRGEPDF